MNPVHITTWTGKEIAVQAEGYQVSKDRPNLLPRERRALMLYKVIEDHGHIRLINELELEEELGAEAFEQLPTD